MDYFLEEAGRCSLESSRVVLLPAPLANTTSWVGGADQGPAAICAASQALELFDDMLLRDISAVGIATSRPSFPPATAQQAAFAAVCADVTRVLRAGKLPVVLGGEHSVTVPAVAACARFFPDLHVVQIDAHMDLRDSYLDDPLSHACVMRRINDLAVPFSQLGIRSFCRQEWQWRQEKCSAPLFTMAALRQLDNWPERVCEQINGPVYLTIDVDGLDPSIMPATGTPEPGGLLWDEVNAFIACLGRQTTIIGFDCVELAPVNGGHHAAFTAAKLIYRTIGCIATGW